jgi:hypothetical protein
MTGNGAAAAFHREVSATGADSTDDGGQGVDIVEISSEEWCVRFAPAAASLGSRSSLSGAARS